MLTEAGCPASAEIRPVNWRIIKMENIRLKIGLAGGVHPNMPGDDEALYRRVAGEFETLAESFGFDLVLESDPLRSEEDSEKAVRRFNDEEVDLTLFFSASLPYGRTALPLAGLRSAIGIWAVPEPVSEGVLQLNSYCGLNMFGSILRNYFPGEDIKYKWFYGMPSSGLFRDRLSVTLGALRAVKKLKNARIGQIGELADGFENLYIDERELRRKFGTRLQSRHTVEDIVKLAKSYSISELDALAEEIRAEGRWSPRLSKADFEKFVRLNRAFFDFAEDNRYDSLAVSCWSKFQEVWDVAVCGVLSRLNSAGIAAPCEADVSSAVCMLILNAVNGEVSSLNDLVALDEDDGSLCLWHCGVAAGCWADSCGICWDSHFNIGEWDGARWNGRGVVADLSYKATELTVFNMQNGFDNLFILSGEVMPGKKGYAGSGGWVDNLRINGSPAAIPELINTVSVGRVNHHYPSAFGNLTDPLNELAFWKDLNVVDKVPYRNYMQKFI